MYDREVKYVLNLCKYLQITTKDQAHTLITRCYYQHL